MKKAKNIGMSFDAPKTTKGDQTDKNDPYYGYIKIRGRTFVGTVTKKGSHRTVTVEWPRTHFIPKFERYEKRRSKVKAHNPDSIDANIGDKVTIVESRPISKTKKFIVVRIEQ
jgi:small subunit ribosomal protein S17